MSTTRVVIDSPHFKVLEPDFPLFRIVKEIPPAITPQLELAVKDFIVSSHLPKGVDPKGFYYQTLQGLASASYLGQGGELWLGTVKGELWIYLMAHVGQDYDQRLTYTVTQAWVKKSQRGKPWVKKVWEQVRQRAKDCMCGHFVVISSRGNDKAYCRFLGKGFHFYASILKEEL
jgi:hypothetical protein